MSNSSRPHGLQPTRLLHPWDSPGKSTGVWCRCLLRGTLLDTFKNYITVPYINIIRKSLLLAPFTDEGKVYEDIKQPFQIITLHSEMLALESLAYTG